MTQKRCSRAILVASISMACASSVFAQSVRTIDAPYPLEIEREGRSQQVVVPVAAKGSDGFVLRTDQPIHEALEAWARNAGWALIWQPSISWKTLKEADFSKSKDVASAVSEVIDILRDEGKPVSLRISDGNRVMEVVSKEVRND
jgi:hypothetical protein